MYQNGIACFWIDVYRSNSYIWIADQSACLIHGLDDCDWRMNWSEYMRSVEYNAEGLWRMLTFMFDVLVEPM